MLNSISSLNFLFALFSIGVDVMYLHIHVCSLARSLCTIHICFHRFPKHSCSITPQKPENNVENYVHVALK